MKKIIVLVLTLGIVMGSATGLYAQEESSSSSKQEENTSSSVMIEAAGGNASSGEAADPSDTGISESTVPSDMNGNWIQKNAEASEIVQTATVQDNTIEVFWLHNNGTGSNLYWSGDIPASAGNNTSFISSNNKNRTGYALMASSEDSKEFSFNNGELSYTVSLLGQEVPVVLVKEETAASASAAVVEGVAQTVNGQPVEFVSGNYSWYKNEGRALCNLYYSVEIRNPNEEFAILNPNVQVTARAEDGSIITTRQEYLPSIAAGDTYVYGAELVYEGNAPARVEMLVGNSNNSYLPQEDSGIISQNMLAVSNISEIKGDLSTKYTGEVTNNSRIDLENAYVIVILKKGNESIGGVSITIDSLASGASRPFEVDLNKDIIDYDSYEIHALPFYPIN